MTAQAAYQLAMAEHANLGSQPDKLAGLLARRLEQLASQTEFRASDAHCAFVRCVEADHPGLQWTYARPWPAGLYVSRTQAGTPAA